MPLGTPAGSWGVRLSLSNKASKALINATPVSLSFTSRVRVMVRPAQFCSLFDATRKHITFTAVAVDLFSNATLHFSVEESKSASDKPRGGYARLGMSYPTVGVKKIFMSSSNKELNISCVT